MDEFVKSLCHPPPPSRWLRWLRQLLMSHCWQYGEVHGGKTYLDARFSEPVVWLIFHGGLPLPEMRQSLCWTKLFTMSWMFGRRPEYRWISERLCIQWNCPRLDLAAEIFCTVSFIFATGKAFNTQFSKQNLACKIWFALSNFSSLITPE